MMNRPKRKEYHGRIGKIYFTEKYIGELEEYCDQLEKALDKFVKYNADAWCCIEAPLDCPNDEADCEKCWKEWAMKDE